MQYDDGGGTSGGVYSLEWRRGQWYCGGRGRYLRGRVLTRVATGAVVLWRSGAVPQGACTHSSGGGGGGIVELGAGGGGGTWPPICAGGTLVGSES